jgi:hypothetical protein
MPSKSSPQSQWRCSIVAKFSMAIFLKFKKSEEEDMDFGQLNNIKGQNKESNDTFLKEPGPFKIMIVHTNSIDKKVRTGKC